MKILYKISVVAFMVIYVATLQSCTKDETSSVPTPELKSQGGNVFYGPTIPIGNGVGRAWVQENASGEPMAVGIDLSDKALQGLGEEPTSWVLLFPRNKGKNFYKHMLVDWNPQGHEPPGVYDLPHFDFHFYTITSEERMQIGPAGAPGFDVLPASQYVPPAYVRIPGGVPQMGTHWADVLAPEFNGGVFTKTFILGSWDGSFIFYEPMITRAYLLSNPDVVTPVRQPSAFEKSGWYPTEYRVSYTTRPNQYTVSLSSLAYHEGQ
jgi:hypothetical protein